MFKFGVFLCYLAVPTPLAIGVFGGSYWLMFAAPTGLFLSGLGLMALDEVC